MIKSFFEVCKKTSEHAHSALDSAYFTFDRKHNDIIEPCFVNNKCDSVGMAK